MITSAVVITPAGTNSIRTEKHPVGQASYQDVDTNESRIGPVASCWSGSTDVVSLTAVVFEHDDGDPNEYRDEIDTLVKAALALAILYFGLSIPPVVLAALREFVVDLVNWFVGSGDDLIETKTEVLNHSLLEWHSGRRTSEHLAKRVTGFPPRIVEFSTGLQHHFVTRHHGGGAKYVVGFDITRNPPIPIDDGPLL